MNAGADPPPDSVEWLLDDGACNTDAVLVTEEVLLVARRAMGGGAAAGGADAPARDANEVGGAFVLARFLRNGGPATERAMPGKSLRFPLVSADRRYAVCMAVDVAGKDPIEAVVVALDQADMPILARIPAGAGVSVAEAYQAAASMQALPAPGERAELAWLAGREQSLVRGDMASSPPPSRG